MESKTTLSSLRLLATGALVIALSGCGAVNKAVNSALPEIDNLTKLNGQNISAVVGSGRAVISGNGTASVTFDDSSLPQADKLKLMKLRQSFSQDVQVTLPGGASAPASFNLSNITLKITLSDADGSAEASATVAGPVTFTRQGATSTYRAAGNVEVSNINFTSETFTSAKEIISMAPSPNTATARLSFDADDTQLPNGTTLTFALLGGKAKVEL